MPVAVGVRDVKEVAAGVVAQLVGLGDEVGEVSGSLIGGEVEEGEGFAALGDNCKSTLHVLHFVEMGVWLLD